MAQAMVNFRMDENLKRRMEDTCRRMGLTMTSAFTIFATRVVEDQKIPFEVVAAGEDPFYSEENMADLRQRIADIEAGINVSEHELIEVD